MTSLDKHRGAAVDEADDDEWGGVEVLSRRDASDDDDPDADEKDLADKGGEMLVVFTFVGTILAAAALPFLLL